MNVKTEGIVLHQFKYSDTQNIVHILTRELGKKSFAVRRSKNKRSSRKGSLTQAFYLVELEFFYNSKKDIQNISEVRLSIPLQSVINSFVKRTVSLFLVEILNKAIREEEKNYEMFDFIYNSIRLFDRVDKGVANFHILFLLKLSRFLGFAPNGVFDKDNPFFDMLNGSFVSTEPLHAYTLKKNQANLLSSLLTTNYDGLESIVLSGKERYEILNIIVQYYQLHIDSLGDIKSLDVLHDVFND
ncbi:MAG: DNA repair protein RecO [Marinilabiliales bacterium]|mgnify:CR=1 FL=1|nr:MAG: DNA repair protein RecO [Marinilabiliales bacterium]